MSEKDLRPKVWKRVHCCHCGWTGPVALTSLVMKSFERLVRELLKKTVKSGALVLKQIAYRAGMGVKDISEFV